MPKSKSEQKKSELNWIEKTFRKNYLDAKVETREDSWEEFVDKDNNKNWDSMPLEIIKVEP